MTNTIQIMPQFAEIVGNEHVKKYLSTIIERKTVVQSWLFAGPEGIGKGLFAERLAHALLEVPFDRQPTYKHPDLYIYKPEGKLGMHSMEMMRQFSKEVYLPPYQAKQKVFIIHAAERMLSYSGNALLKTFEEPASTSIIILLSSYPEQILPTVRSRCFTVYFKALSELEICTLLTQQEQKTPEEAQQIARYAQGSLAKAKKWMEEGEHSLQKRVLQFLAEGGYYEYHRIHAFVKAVNSSIEENLQKQETASRDALKDQYVDTPTSLQKHAMEKEVEGILAMHTRFEVEEIFSVVLGWYRDMHLLSVNGSASLLFYPFMADACLQAFQRGSLLPLEQVQSIVDHARKLVERSTPIVHSLENLFIQLDVAS